MGRQLAAVPTATGDPTYFSDSLNTHAEATYLPRHDEQAFLLVQGDGAFQLLREPINFIQRGDRMSSLVLVSIE